VINRNSSAVSSRAAGKYNLRKGPELAHAGTEVTASVGGDIGLDVSGNGTGLFSANRIPMQEGWPSKKQVNGDYGLTLDNMFGALNNSLNRAVNAWQIAKFDGHQGTTDDFLRDFLNPELPHQIFDLVPTPLSPMSHGPDYSLLLHHYEVIDVDSKIIDGSFKIPNVNRLFNEPLYDNPTLDGPYLLNFSHPSTYQDFQVNFYFMPYLLL